MEISDIQAVGLIDLLGGMRVSAPGADRQVVLPPLCAGFGPTLCRFCPHSVQVLTLGAASSMLRVAGATVEVTAIVLVVAAAVAMATAVCWPHSVQVARLHRCSEWLVLRWK